MEKLLDEISYVNGNRKLKLYFFDEIDSTNNFAKKLIEEGTTDEAVIIARTQTAGRGRQGKSFYSPSDSGIYMTVVLNPNSKISTVVTLTAKIACIVAKSIYEVYGIQVGIKWVNDLYLNNRKVCGILCEADNDYDNMLLKHVYVGIGINMTTIDFPEDIKNSAGSLMMNSAESEGSYRKDFEKTFGENHENNYSENYENNYNENIKNNSGENSEENDYNSYRFRNLVECIIRNVYGTYLNSFENFIDYYREHSIVVGEKIYFLENNIKVNATVRDIDPEGGLMVICENGEKKTLRSGEITVRLI